MHSKVLVVEDNKKIVMMVRMALEARGYKVAVAGDGVSGIEEARRFAPDLILLDLVLPTLDGFDVLRALKRERSTHSIPVVVISAKAADDDIREAKRSGASEYLVKPFTPDELVGTVAHILGP